MGQITCKFCRSENLFITADKLATCRECGLESEFHYGQVPSIEELKNMILEGCNNSKAAAGQLVKDFFWYKEKDDVGKFAAYFNAYQVQNFGFPFKTSGVIVFTVDQPNAKLITSQTPSEFRGTVLIHHNGFIFAAFEMVACVKIVDASIAKTYADDIANGLKMLAPDCELGDYTANRFGWIGTDYRVLEKPIEYTTRKGNYIKYYENI